MATYYFCDNQPGAAATCIPGNDANPGTDPNAPRRTLNGFTIHANDVLRYAQGGAWSNVAAIIAPNGTTFESYAHPGFSSSAKPILNMGVDGNGAGVSPFLINKVSDVVVRNLDMRANPATTYANGLTVLLSPRVLIENSVITGFYLGISSGPGDQVMRSADVTIRNNELSYNSGGGFFGAADRLVLEGNFLHHNGSKNNSRDHNIYLSPGYTNIVVRSNTLTFNEQADGSTTSASVSMVAHGFLPNLTIEDNVIIDLSCTYGHYGMALNGVTGASEVIGFPGLVIRGNLVVTAQKGALGITWNSAPDAICENNVLVHIGGTSNYAGIVFDVDVPNAARGDYRGARAKVRNNTIYCQWAQPGNGSLCGGIRTSTNGDGGDEVTNNLVVLASDVLYSDLKAFNVGARALASFAAFRNNMGYCVPGAVGNTLTWSNLFTTLAQAQAAGWDAGSINANPLLANTPNAGNNYNVSLQSGSPAIDAGHAAMRSTLAYGRKVVIGQRDIGAEDYGATVIAPQPPTGTKAF